MKSIQFRGHTINYQEDDGFWQGLVRENDPWEKETFDILEKYLGEGKVLFDIGAWNGVFSVYANKLGSTAFALEPDEVAYNKLVENMMLNDANSLFPSKLAVAEFGGEITLYNHDQFGNSMSSTMRKDGECVRVKCYTIDEFGSLGPFHLIKMDIEGAELQVIPSSMEFFKQQNCPLLLATHPYYYPRNEIDENMMLILLSEIFHLTKIAKDQYLCIPKP